MLHERDTKFCAAFDQALSSEGIILVVRGGAIVEAGRHEQLLQAGGLYARFYELQFREEEKLTAP